MNNDESLFQKSKSQVKREMIELQDLGERLILLNKEQLKHLDLPPILLEAVNECKKISSRSAKKRQHQYIGRLMRDIEDTSSIRDFFEEIEKKNNKTTAFYHMLESWRERLLSEDNEATTQFIQQYPNIDRQHLRQLIQNAKKERQGGKPVGASKLLFRYLKELHSDSQKSGE